MKSLQLEVHRKEHQSMNRMNLKNSILMFSMLFLLAIGCDKPAIDHNVKWKGKVLEKGTNKPISNAKIYLYEFEFGGDFTIIKPRILINTYESDKDGNYDFTYFNDISKGYVIKVGAEKYYLSGEYTPNDNDGIASNTVFYLDPYAWIKFHVKNVNPFDENDKIDINRSCFSKILYGNRIDTTIICEEIGNKNLELVWWVTKNNNKTRYIDTIPYLKAHDTTCFEIKY